MDFNEYSPSKKYFIKNRELRNLKGKLYDLMEIDSMTKNKAGKFYMYLIIDAETQEDAIWIADKINDYLEAKIYGIVYSREYKNFDLQRRDCNG